LSNIATVPYSFDARAGFFDFAPAAWKCARFGLRAPFETGTRRDREKALVSVGV
jgi:hypothetical protein